LENPPFKGQYHKYFVPSEWLTKRGLSPETLERFGVGEYSNPARQSAYKGKIDHLFVPGSSVFGQDHRSAERDRAWAERREAGERL
jgi:hypothetical protein